MPLRVLEINSNQCLSIIQSSIHLKYLRQRLNLDFYIVLCPFREVNANHFQQYFTLQRIADVKSCWHSLAKFISHSASFNLSEACRISMADCALLAKLYRTVESV